MEDSAEEKNESNYQDVDRAEVFGVKRYNSGGKDNVNFFSRNNLLSGKTVVLLRSPESYSQINDLIEIYIPGIPSPTLYYSNTGDSTSNITIHRITSSKNENSYNEIDRISSNYECKDLVEVEVEGGYSADLNLSTLKYGDFIEENPYLNPRNDNFNLYSPSVSFSFQSPKPMQSFSPVNKSLLFRRNKLVEEFIQSEQDFATSLRYLSVYYLDPMISKSNHPSQLGLLYGVLEVIRHFHDQFIVSLNCMAIEGSTDSFIEIITEFFKKLSKANSLYVDYINIYKEIFDGMEILEKRLDIQSTIVSAKLLLESIQPFASKLDLSFYSLLLKPISRISKYKVLVESFLKYNPNNGTKEQEAYNQILEVLDSSNVQVSLEENSNKILFTNKIYSIIEQDKMIIGMLQFCGCLYCIWMENNNQLVHQSCVVLIFKSHLVVATSPLKKKKDIIFLIPFVSCKIVYKDFFEGGFYSNYSYKIKVLFEHDFQKFEILMIATNLKEYEIWKENFETFQELNGRNLLKSYIYSIEQMNFPIETQIKYPVFLSPFELEVSRFSVEKIKSCYFSRLITFEIDLGNNEQKDTSKRSNYYININTMLRKQIERQLSLVWPKELPLLQTIERGMSKKRRSWFN